ncbi:MAG: FtsW/RodA/SpoVE family cell cycle protein [Paludibacteraceae bacterium]|nr:FtsW/RodA/SpoVE family cell cycle protein [Paludibacteraceae bacterium]
MIQLPHSKHIDKVFWLLFILLGAVSLISLFSASSTLVYKQDSVFEPIGRHFFFLIIGFIAAYFIQFMQSRWIRYGGYVVLIIADIFVYSLLIPNNPFAVTRNEATRWMNLFGFEFQPSELAKVALVIVIADQLARINSEEDKKKIFFRTLIITGLTVLPIMTSNMSTAILMCMVVFFLWILARLPWKYILSTAGAAIAAATCIVLFVVLVVNPNNLKLPRPFSRLTTQVGRITHEKQDVDKTSMEFLLSVKEYQPTLSKVAIARGGASPIGVGAGNSKERDYLPQAYADYIFAIIVEESGIVGAFLLISLYLCILFRACYTSTRFNDYPAMLMVMGLALMITCQALISMMVTVGIGPVTGQPLPLISRGGTSVVITCIYFGVMMCVSREQAEKRDRQQEVIATSMEDVPDIQLETNN